MFSFLVRVFIYFLPSVCTITLVEQRERLPIATNRSDEGLTLETSAFLPFTVANYVFNPDVNTKLPAILSLRRSTTVSLEKEVSGAGKAWNDRRFFYWIHRLSDAAVRATYGCTVLFTRHQSTKVCQAFSKFWLVFWISTFRSMLCRWTSREKCIDIKISRHNFICYYSWKFWRNLTKIGPIYKIVRVVFLPKSNARFMLIKVRKQLASRQEIISSPETAKQWYNGTYWRQWRYIKISRET